MRTRLGLKYEEFRALKEALGKALNVIKQSDRVSARYLEGFIYSLLSAIRANNQNAFLHYLVTFLNTFDDKDIGEFMQKLLECFPISDNDFQKVGYMIVIGLMSIKGGE